MFPRDRQPELMDDPQLACDEHRQALAGLARLNRCSGVASTMYRYLRRFASSFGDRPLTVLDVASGSGDVPLSWLQRAKRDQWQLQLTMLDISSTAVEEQENRAKKLGVSALSLQQDCLNGPLPGGFDLVTCSLFMHHLDEQQVFRLLQSMQAAAQHGMVVCDLERSQFNLMLVNLGAKLLSRSRVVHHDAAASVRAAFTSGEFEQIARQALARPIRMHRAFPCRFIAVVAETAVEQPVPTLALQGTS
ncbi:methyltransferase domain-containing protein [Rubripirellula sp.]|nr:methyltransferase domain-containing protein [Planctomycetaceae bacterium]MDA9859011.1 methyltransferase domain-containing protein [Rubripirellula sp.]MDF1844743.1 methyltransferase domain-containing protein [Rubripirellula sp.]